jgi:hypothetical protein
MGKRTVLGVGDKKNNVPQRKKSAATQQNIDNFSFLQANPSLNALLKIFPEKRANVRRFEGLKGIKLKNIIWMGQMNVKNGSETDEFVKEHAKVIGQKMGVTNSVHRK